MAIVNEILVGRYNRAIQKLLNMKGPASLRQIAGELISTWQFFNGVENRVLESIFTYEQAQPAGPVAAQTNAFQLRNPLTSGIISVIESLIVEATVNDLFEISHSNANPADLATVLGGAATDSRIAIGPSSIYSFSSASVGFLVNSLKHVAVPANSALELIQQQNQEIVLGPGSAVRINNNVVNTTNRVSIRWRERVLEESERSV